MKLKPVMIAAAMAAALNVQAAEIKSEEEKVSYIVGMQIAQQLKAQGIPVDEEALFAGIRDQLAGEVKFDQAQISQVMQDFQQRQQQEQAQVGDRNKEQGEAFLAANLKKPGVKATDSGLQYKVITQGEGKIPQADDQVSVHYRGTLIDGTEFDSSYQRGEPATFPVRGVIKGWIEALQMMPVGSKWELYIPSGLAYGPRGAGAQIGPNSTLVFEVELLEIN